MATRLPGHQTTCMCPACRAARGESWKTKKRFTASINTEVLTNLRKWVKEHNTSLTSAIEEAGTGILLTTIILSIGFIIFLFSGSPPVKYFGLLSVAALIAAFLGDVVFLPFFIKILIRDS